MDPHTGVVEPGSVSACKLQHIHSTLYIACSLVILKLNLMVAMMISMLRFMSSLLFKHV